MLDSEGIKPFFLCQCLEVCDRHEFSVFLEPPLLVEKNGILIVFLYILRPKIEYYIKRNISFIKLKFYLQPQLYFYLFGTFFGIHPIVLFAIEVNIYFLYNILSHFHEVKSIFSNHCALKYQISKRLSK